ncbi:MAG: insulinase family protein [Deltaproteobacteria bacterium]|nr:insulinase family protein [Deltaproteobacteria bacterium]
MAVIASGCAHWAATPRYGSLRDDARPFAFAHNIDLVKVTNGLTVALIPDDRTNLATVDMRYDVGAAEDPPGRAGMAHLVEHLVFDLREHADGPTLGDELDDIALYMNASTTWDQTHYRAIVPIERLQAALAFEARRMTARCDQLDDATFARERDVVLAEGAERDAPLRDTYYRITAAAYGKRHPYARRLTSNELAGATKAEACAFIAAHYRPDRAMLVVSGHVDDRIRPMIGKVFGAITAPRSAPRVAIAPPTLRGETTQLRAPVTHPTTVIVLPYPAWGDNAIPAYTIARRRLARELDAETDTQAWLRDATVFTLGGPRAPALAVAMEVESPGDLAKAADLVFHHAKHLFDDSWQTNLHWLGTRLNLEYADAWDDAVGRGAWIADYLQYAPDRWFMLREMRIASDLAIEKVRKGFADAWSRDHSLIVNITPTGKADHGRVADAVPTGSHTTTAWRWPVDAELADQPVPVRATSLADRVERFELPNGLTVELAPDPQSPLVEARLLYPVGRAHEPRDSYGLATAAAGLLDQDREGTYKVSAAMRLNRAVMRGTVLDWNVSETTTSFVARGLAYQGDWHVWYLSWLLDLGRYNQADLDALHEAARKHLARTAKAKPEIDRDAAAFLARLFGPSHPYATPAPDADSAFLRLRASDLQAWRAAYYRPRGATLVITGAFDKAAMRKEVEELFGPWSGAAPNAPAAIPPFAPASGPSWLAADDADATQVALQIGFPAASDPTADAAAREVLEAMLEDALRDVREAMGASYGVHASYAYGAAGGALLISGKVDEHLAPEAARAVLAAIATLRDNAAGQREAFVRARRKAIADAQAQTGGAQAVGRRLAALVARGLPLDFDRAHATAIGQLTPAAVAKVAAQDLASLHMVVQIGGKPAIIDGVFAALGATPERPK